MQSKNRIYTLDELRGLCVFCMVIYHALYTASFLFSIEYAVFLFRLFTPAEPFIAAAFIIISGISSQLSRNNFKRSLPILAAAAAVSLATYFVMPKSMIYFGILHFLGVSILIFSVAKKHIDKIPFAVAIVLFALLFFITYGVKDNVLGISSFGIALPHPSTDYFLILGFVSDSFSSADYFPLLPWFFAFLFGTTLGRLAREEKFPKFMYKKRSRILSYIGTHAFLIYILHQPVIYGLLYLIFLLQGKV
ncbi:MAG: DUF1624 domain-containing protein [Acutalibacteraceae bacterium]